MESKFTRIVVPDGRSARFACDHSVTVGKDVLTLRIGNDYGEKRATFESDGNGTLRIVMGDDGDYQVASWGGVKQSVRISARALIRHLGLKPGRYQGRLEGNALYLNLNEMVQQS